MKKGAQHFTMIRNFMTPPSSTSLRRINIVKLINASHICRVTWTGTVSEKTMEQV